MAELTVENLHLQYGDNPILKGVTMTLNRGEVVSLLGPSGSGKTTLLRAVAGLEVPHQGSIRIGDKVVFDGSRRIDVPAEARNLGLVFQSYALWPHKTVFDNVAYGLKLRNVGASDVDSAGQPLRSSNFRSATWRSASRTSCRADSSSAWRSRVRWSTTRR